MLVQEAIQTGKPFYMPKRRGSKEPTTYYKHFKRGTGPFADHPNCYFAAMTNNILTLVDWWFILNGKQGISRRWKISQKQINFEEQ